MTMYGPVAGGTVPSSRTTRGGVRTEWRRQKASAKQRLRKSGSRRVRWKVIVPRPVVDDDPRPRGRRFSAPLACSD